MPRIDLVKKIPISASGRARKLEGMFDVPRNHHITSHNSFHFLTMNPANAALVPDELAIEKKRGSLTRKRISCYAVNVSCTSTSTPQLSGSDCRAGRGK
jgi:hypothetical protein